MSGIPSGRWRTQTWWENRPPLFFSFVFMTTTEFPLVAAYRIIHPWQQTHFYNNRTNNKIDNWNINILYILFTRYSIVACYYFKNSVALWCSLSYVFHWLFLCVNLCLLNKHTGSRSSVADCFLPLFPTGHGLAVMLVYKKGSWHSLLSQCMCIYLFIYFNRLHI